MKTKISIFLLAAASCGSGLAATGILGGHEAVFTTTGVVHRGEAYHSQAFLSGQSLGTISVSEGAGNKGVTDGVKTNSTVIPEPAIAFLGIIGLALLLLRRK